MYTSKSKLSQRDRIVALAILAGVVVAMLSALESTVPWIASFCGLLGDGCQDTAQYRLLGFPISPWGMIYYAVLGLLFFRKRAWLFWAVMVGIGSELVLARIMVEGRFVCVFCTANLLVIVVLFLCYLDKKRIWQMISGIAVTCIVSSFLISDGTISTQMHNRFRLPDAPLATVGDRTITVQDVERPLTSELYRRQQDIYKLKRLVLETRINEALLEMDAQARGITVESLIGKIRAKVSPPAQHIIDHYYDSKLYRQWGSWTGSEQQIKQQIREYLHTRESNPLVLDYYQQLRKKYPVDDFLTEPPVPATQVRIGNAPSQGPSNAPVLVMELSDYHCPACRKGHKVVKQIKDKYKGKIRWVFKDYPLKKHPGAKDLALAARYAHTQGKFWDFQELLFSAKHKPTLEDALSYANKLGLNPTLLQQYMADPQSIQALEQDVAELREAGIGSTPTFIINGALRSGMPSFEEFSELIDKALQNATDGAE